MNKEQSSKVAEAELDLNNALVNADIRCRTSMSLLREFRS